MLTEKLNTQNKKQSASLYKEQGKPQVRLDELKKITQKLYEDNALGNKSISTAALSVTCANVALVNHTYADTKKGAIQMAKWCLNYDSGEYEYIEKDGYSIDRGEYVYNWDDSEYKREEAEENNRSLFDDDDD